MLETERLALRPFCRRDLEPAVALANDEAVAPRTAGIPYPFTLADAEAWWERHASGRTDARELVFALERKQDGAFLGAAGLALAGPEEAAAIGYWLGRPYWGQGYMSEALRRLLDYAFDGLDAIAVRAAAFPDNDRSIRVQERLGMTLVGREIQPTPARGENREVVVREVRRERWRR